MKLGQRRISFLWLMAEHLYPEVPEVIWQEIAYCQAKLKIAAEKAERMGRNATVRRTLSPTAISHMMMVEVAANLGLNPLLFARATSPIYRNFHVVRQRMKRAGMYPPEGMKGILR